MGVQVTNKVCQVTNNVSTNTGRLSRLRREPRRTVGRVEQPEQQFVVIVALVVVWLLSSIPFNSIPSGSVRPMLKLSNLCGAAIGLL